LLLPPENYLKWLKFFHFFKNFGKSIFNPMNFNQLIKGIYEKK